MILEVTDEKGNNLASEFGVNIDYGDRSLCSEACPANDEDVCVCDSLELFDVKGQMLRLF